MTAPRIGLDHLTALGLPPAALVSAAGAAGFASVSLRTVQIPGGEAPWAVDGVDTAEIRRVVDATDVRIHAIEAVAIDEDLPERLDAMRPTLAQGADLGADLLYAFGDDTELARLIDAFGQLSQVAAAFGLRTLLEPMPYRAVATVAQAAQIARAVPGTGVIVDTLHAARGAASPASLAAIEPDLLAVLQLCDGPSAAPTSSPSGLHPLQHEARFDRREPGAGGLPLARYVAAMPADAVITVEAPAPSHADGALAGIRAAAADVLRGATA